MQGLGGSLDSWCIFIECGYYLQRRKHGLHAELWRSGVPEQNGLRLAVLPWIQVWRWMGRCRQKSQHLVRLESRRTSTREAPTPETYFKPSLKMTRTSNMLLKENEWPFITAANRKGLSLILAVPYPCLFS